MLQSLLAAGVLGCLLAGRVANLVLAGICLGIFLGVFLLRRHSHDNWAAIDGYAQRSHLGGVSAGLKWLTALCVIVLVLAADCAAVSLTAIFLAWSVTIFLGKTPMVCLGRLFLTPATFVLLSALALLFDVTQTPLGVIQIPFLGRYLSVTAPAQEAAARIILGALACVAWLYSLCLSTPLYALITPLRRIHVPKVMIELMYLIYRYIFVLSGTLGQMQTAAKSRLGTASVRAGMRSAGRIMSGLLTASFRKASASFDAMLSRCYGGTLEFLERPRPLRWSHCLTAAGLVAALGIITLIKRGVFL